MSLVAPLTMPLFVTSYAWSALSPSLNGYLGAAGIISFSYYPIVFLLVAAALYFFVVAPMNAIAARRNRGEAPPDPTTKKCPDCLSEIPIAARRCAFCTSALGVQ